MHHVLQLSYHHECGTTGLVVVHINVRHTLIIKGQAQRWHCSTLIQGIMKHSAEQKMLEGGLEQSRWLRKCSTPAVVQHLNSSFHNHTHSDSPARLTHSLVQWIAMFLVVSCQCLLVDLLQFELYENYTTEVVLHSIRAGKTEISFSCVNETDDTTCPFSK